MLDGIRILDFTWAQAGPVATLLLSDMGADVLKVERPEGDMTRRNSPRPGGVSWVFSTLNRGKRSITLDLASQEDRERALALAGEADVVVENFKPGTMAKFGLDADALLARNPQLIYASCSGFGSGEEAGRPAFDLVIQAASGLMQITGPPDGGPVRVPFSPGDIGAGMYLAIGILGALQRRNATGQGAHVEVSMIDCQLSMMWEALTGFEVTGREPPRHASRIALAAPYQAFAARDAHVVVAVGTDDQFRRLCAALDRPELAEDPRFARAEDRVINVEALDAELSRTLETLDADDAVGRMEAAGVPGARVAEVGEVPYAEDLFVDLGEYGRVMGTPIVVDGERQRRTTPPVSTDAQWATVAR